MPWCTIIGAVNLTFFFVLPCRHHQRSLVCFFPCLRSCVGILRLCYYASYTGYYAAAAHIKLCIYARRHAYLGTIQAMHACTFYCRPYLRACNCTRRLLYAGVVSPNTSAVTSMPHATPRASVITRTEKYRVLSRVQPQYFLVFICN